MLHISCADVVLKYVEMTGGWSQLPPAPGTSLGIRRFIRRFIHVSHWIVAVDAGRVAWYDQSMLIKMIRPLNISKLGTVPRV